MNDSKLTKTKPFLFCNIWTQQFHVNLSVEIILSKLNSLRSFPAEFLELLAKRSGFFFFLGGITLSQIICTHFSVPKVAMWLGCHQKLPGITFVLAIFQQLWGGPCSLPLTANPWKWVFVLARVCGRFVLDPEAVTMKTVWHRLQSCLADIRVRLSPQ